MGTAIRCWLPLVLSACLLCLAATSSSSSSKGMVCEPITVPMCRGIGYNLTRMPNQFHHDTQEEVGLEVHQFWPLVRIRCSPDLLFFLCSVYTPICLPDYGKPLPPCRSVCERARRGCAPLMSQYGFEWPERMSCERLPALGDAERLCMDRSGTEAAATTTPSPTARAPPRPGPPRRRPAPPCDGECRCREPLVPLGGVQTGPLSDCALPCHQPYLSAEERAFTASWLGLWSALCFASTLATVATFLIEPKRFRYPERPVVFLAACYSLVSLGYLARLVAGHERVACGAGGRHVLYTSTGPALCTLVFLLIYFFGMAASIWWVVLSFTWFLAAGMKWGHEAIAGYAQYFHLASWLVPSVQTAAALALGAVDGDPVAGICYVGNQSLGNLRGLVLAPLALYLLTGALFLLAGFVSLFRIRSVVKQGGTKTDKLERLMIRLGLFAVLYTVPAAALLACLLYEQHNRPAWERALGCSCAAERQHLGPDYAVFMLKYFVSLVVGITSGVWVWSGKTLESWRRFLAHCQPCRGHKACANSLGGEATAATAPLTTCSGSCHKPISLSHV